MAELVTIKRLGLTRIGIDQAFNNEISFQASAIQFSSDITPNYTETFVYGRNDPIVSYKNTTRSIKFSFSVASENSLNGDMNTLTQMLYPVYDDVNVIVGSPLFRIKFSNILCDETDPTQGLVCALSNVLVGPSFEYGRVLGVAGDFGATGIGVLQNGAAFKTFKVAMTIRPLHSKPSGFDTNGNWKGGSKNSELFPFGNS